MAPKSVKKPAAKKPVAKKIVTKKVTTKKVAPVVVPVAHECACGGHCHCAHHCGGKFGRIVKKIIIFAIIFALGFAAAKFIPCHKGPRMPKPQFENGCLVVDSIKCPKLLEKLPALDVNHDGCVSKEEFRAAKRMFAPAKKHGKRPMRGERPMHGPAPVTK